MKPANMAQEPHRRQVQGGRINNRMSTHFKMSHTISKSGSFCVLPAGHYRSRRDLEPEETAHARDIGSRKNDMSAFLSNVPLCLIEIFNENVVRAFRNLRFLSWSYADGRPCGVLECKLLACRHVDRVESPTEGIFEEFSCLA